LSYGVKKQDAAYIIKEAALLIESGAYKHLDALILVSCPEEIRIKRSMKRDGSDRDKIIDRVRRQLDEDAMRAYCKYEIVNDNIQLIIPQVMTLHEKLKFTGI